MAWHGSENHDSAVVVTVINHNGRSWNALACGAVVAAGRGLTFHAAALHDFGYVPNPMRNGAHATPRSGRGCNSYDGQYTDHTPMLCVTDGKKYKSWNKITPST